MNRLVLLSLLVLFSGMTISAVAQQGFESRATPGFQPPIHQPSRLPSSRGRDSGLSSMSSPPFQNPGMPDQQESEYVDVYTCSKCNKEVSATSKKCPHCGIFFTEDGSTGGFNLRGRSVAKLIGLGVVIVFAIGGFLFKMLSGGGNK